MLQLLHTEQITRRPNNIQPPHLYTLYYLLTQAEIEYGHSGQNVSNQKQSKVMHDQSPDTNINVSIEKGRETKYNHPKCISYIVLVNILYHTNWKS